MTLTTFAWGCATGYIIAKILDAIGAIRSAKRQARRDIAEARAKGARR